ncbi:hypothetical protein HYPSUDRAFT_60196 [Hypholoma sublateritium FD-334 SS-4]|uniref:DUF6532 domain-containing protein n=1 Tax=Hypholoma sublateritium (strain FD-334 SS-4) TaxID=945553 RepID=A0A0D2N7X1_HYPSF|nr:hypothetical protein HYPSUDRAFT_60196 [Hypholoma sublateritium FD-334 SS-4]
MNFSDDPFGQQLQTRPDSTSYNNHEGHSNYNNHNFYDNIQNGFEIDGYQQNGPDVMHHGQDGGSFYQNESNMPGNIPSSINSANMLAFLEDGLTRDTQHETDSRSDLDGPSFETPEHSQARDLFLPEPREYDSDDGLSYCDKTREDGHESDHDDDDDIEVDEASPSEDEAAAVAALHAASPRAEVRNEDGVRNEDNNDHLSNAGDIEIDLQAHGEDVLQAHRQRNRPQKPPKTNHLKDSASRQDSTSHNTTSPREDGDDDSHSQIAAEAGHEVDPVKKSRATRNSKNASLGSSDNPEALGFYTMEWTSVLVQAQQRWQRHLILGRENPFPIRSDHLHEARRILTDVISESLNGGQLLDDSYTRTREMDICVFAEHSTWRGELKTVAIPIVTAKYEDLITVPTEYHGSQLKAWRLVREKIKSILEDSSFHIYGVDDSGQTNNFAHPAIPQIIISFFYTGNKCLAALFPDDFRHAVPVHAIALVVTTIQNCLDEWVEYVHRRTTVQFLGRNYCSTFDSIMTAINDVKADPYHGAKFEANRKLWARMGMANLEGSNLQMENRRVKVVLD